MNRVKELPRDGEVYRVWQQQEAVTIFWLNGYRRTKIAFFEGRPSASAALEDAATAKYCILGTRVIIPRPFSSPADASHWTNPGRGAWGMHF